MPTPSSRNLTRSDFIATVTHHEPATRNGIECSCGWTGDTGTAYATHLADVLHLTDNQPTSQRIPDTCPTCGQRWTTIGSDAETPATYRPCGHPVTLP